MSEIIQERQSLLDVAVQSSGKADEAILIAIENGLNLTDELIPGDSFEGIRTIDKTVVKSLASRNLKPATALSENDVVNGGINYMGIEIDFIVS